MLLRVATEAGAEIIGSRVFRAAYDGTDRVELSYLLNNVENVLHVNFAVFAGGVNDRTNRLHPLPTSMELFQQLQPAYVPPGLRKALIFELETKVSLAKC